MAKLEGPIIGGKHGWPFAGYYGDIGAYDYEEEEFFFSGVAQRFAPVGALAEDGRWTVEPSGAAPFKTRMLLRKPRRPEAFNGAVIVEWNNVSFGLDILLGDSAGIYDGFAYVGVSAQRIGLTGYASDPQGLQRWDPERYGALFIPDDSYSFDIFTQAARLLRDRGGPLPGYDVRKLIGVGASQSGSRILAYTNAIQPRERAFDALMPLVSAGTASLFGAEMAHPDPAERRSGMNAHSTHIRTRVRDDVATPVMTINTETEALFYSGVRQPDTARFVSWEIAGASHGPTDLLAALKNKFSRDQVRGLWDRWRHSSDVSWSPTLATALHHVHGWLNGGPPPPSQAPMQLEAGGKALARDAFGNALGGVRLPEVEVPIARYAGFGPAGEIGGLTEPLPAAVLQRLYPTHETYVEKVRAAALAAKAAGVVSAERCEDYIAAAARAPIPA